jgi:serine/threonine protein kinase
MLGEHGEIFLVDWGLSQKTGDVRESFWGTPLYAAPEQLTLEPASPQTDLYQLGATLYHWLTLRPPLDDKVPLNQLLADVLSKKPREPVMWSHHQQGRVPIEMSRLIMMAIEKDPKKRPTSVAAWSEELRMILEGNIQAICPCTTIKKSMYFTERLIDNSPFLGMLLVLLWLLAPLIWLINTVFGWWLQSSL